ncbi:unnamed protein product, partial [Prorocentrum cordatum]
MAVESASPLWLLPARMSRLLACRGGCGLLVHSEAAGPRGREYGKFAGFCCLRCKEAQGAGDHGKKCEHQQAPDGTPRFGEEAPLRDGHAEQHGVKHYRGEVGGQVVTVIVCEDPRHKHVQFALGWAEEARHLWGEELPERGTREVWPGCNAAQPGDERLCAVVPDGPKVFGLGGSLLSPPSADASQSARASTRSSGRAPSTSPLRSTARPRSRRGSAPGAFQRSCGICRRRRCRRPPCRGRRRAMPPALGRAREAAWRRRSAGRRGRSTARPRGAAPPRQSGGPRPRGGRWSRPRGPSPTATDFGRDSWGSGGAAQPSASGGRASGGWGPADDRWQRGDRWREGWGDAWTSSQARRRQGPRAGPRQVAPTSDGVRGSRQERQKDVHVHESTLVSRARIARKFVSRGRSRGSRGGVHVHSWARTCFVGSLSRA